MKKFILPLIIILILSFTLTGYCWVGGYDQRIKLTTDHTKIDDTLSDFPVTAFFTATQAEEIFAEFDEDADFDRGQFALGDNTLLYAEKELFDVSEIDAIYHIKIPTTSPDVDTDFYYYFDNDADHNTDYIGGINGRAEVWNNNFKMVQHMVDSTTSTIKDSTSNNNNGTKTSANNPLTAIAKVGYGQDFSNDRIVIPDSADLDLTSNFLIEAIVNIDDLSDNRVIISKFWDGTTRAWHLTAVLAGYFLFVMRQSGDGADTGVDSAAGTAVTGNWIYVAILNDGTNYQFYINGVASGSAVTKKTMNTNNANVNIGDWAHTSLHEYMDGIEDEIRVSNFTGTERNPAWIKATYNSLWDALLTYGSEETLEAAEDNAIFFGMNF